MSKSIFNISVTFLLAFACLAQPVQAQDFPPEGDWKVTAYLWAMALDGEVGIGPITADIDLSFSDLLDALNYGGEPIQQMYGTRECDGRFSEKKMQEWPTFRMPFRAFAKAYPNGTVFLNKIPKITQNPFLWLFDNLVEIVFLWGTVPHDRTESLMFDTMDVDDDRLRRKEYVWGFNIGKDSVAYTEDFIRENSNLVNARVGDREIVAAFDPEYESVGIWYNDSGNPVICIDFWGDSDQGKLQRVETVKAATYWCVWVNFFPETDLNRSSGMTADDAALAG
jgi:hypothetical protein